MTARIERPVGLANGQTLDVLNSLVFANEAANFYAVLDGASIPNLLLVLDRLGPEYECLYRGELLTDMEEVAPYLVRLQPETEFADWLLGTGWGAHWGVFAAADADLASMRRHFRKFLIVHDESGKPLYFRFYDPRVLRVFLPTCDATERKNLFGPVIQYLFESDDRSCVVASNGAEGLIMRRQTLLPEGQ